MLIDVLVNIKTFGEKVFTYKSNEKVLIGSRVEVPLMKRSIIGIVIGYKKDCDYEVKEIIRVIDTKPILNEELIELGKYMRDTYLSSLVASYEAMLPKSLKLADSKINIKYVTYIKKIKNKDNPTKGEANILDLFCYEDLVVKSKVKNREILKRLINEGILEEVKCEVNRYNIDSTDSSLKVLTKEQSDAYNQIKNSKKDIVLLHGVTGSGKTEVYMHLISDTLKNGKNAIVLVPEISLTTQVISRFRSVFKDIAVLHSGLSDGERFDEYRKIAGNKVRLVIGTRSAIFAPLSNIGIIIIDEEHEDTYKQENNPRYNALIRLGLWFIFFTLVIVFIRLSPKEEVPKKEEKVQITYNDIKKEFANSSVMLTMSNDTYYVSGVIKDGVFNGTIQNDGITNKVYYDGVMYIVNKNNKEETSMYNELNNKLILPKDIINTIDNYNGLLKSTTEGKNYTYDINGEKYIIYIKEEKICKVTYEKDNLVYTLEYNYL